MSIPSFEGPSTAVALRKLGVMQAQAEQHANELLNQWEHAKKGLIAASGSRQLELTPTKATH